MGFFVLESLWLVASARYPMAFDEQYHFGLIQLHAHQWLPFFTHQPPHAASFGPIVRDPSYLYHWLLSFPYRGVALITHNQTAHIVVLRLLNLVLFTYGLILARRVLRATHVSQALTNSIFAVFVLVPVVPYMAAQINYDNLLFVVLGLVSLLTLKNIGYIADKRLHAPSLLLLAALLALGCLVKYPFLPVALVTGAFLLVLMLRARLLGGAGLRAFIQSFAAQTWLRRTLLVLSAVVAVGLFAERYGQNLVTYHNPVPSCDIVITVNECKQYGPYSRDAQLKAEKAEKAEEFHPGLLTYSFEWLYGMWYRLFFSVSYDYTTAAPLIGIGVVGALGAVVLVMGVALRFRSIFSGYSGRQYLFWMVMGYSVVLFANGYKAYAETGQPVAINGRYLLPFLPFILALGGLAWAQLWRHHATAKAVVASLVIVFLLLQGGGAATYIIRSWDSWQWDDATVRSANHFVRSTLWSTIPGKGVQAISP